LLHLPGELQDVVASRALPLAVVKVLSEIDHEPYRRDLIREATRTGATTATVELWRAQYLADRTRIVQNLMTIEEIASRREAWKIKIDCDLCQEEREYQDTQSPRVCRECWAEILRLVEREARLSITTTPPA